MTAYSDENIRARAMRDGAVGYLLKPVDANHLIGYLDKALKAA
jgi:FixJ family two-component response regulator